MCLTSTAAISDLPSRANLFFCLAFGSLTRSLWQMEHFEKHLFFSWIFVAISAWCCAFVTARRSTR
eukprot:m.790932 g.790932  ORF g.790932 m.790932 type:complete len:66 (-) comp59208_c1_seq2:270-467(-)